MDETQRRRRPADLQLAMWLAPDGWPLRSFALGARSAVRGSILFVGGRGDFLEKYLEAFAHWADRGWQVAGFDWRGQGGSGREHPAGLCHVADFATLRDDLAAFCTDWRARTPGPHVVIGHSMGGHVMLRAAAATLVEPDAMVLLSPMIGIRAGPLRGAALHGVARIGNLPLLRERPIWSGPSSPRPGRITSSMERHADKLWWKAQHPELARGAPTWGWLAAATRSMATLDRQLRLRPVTLPGLIVTAASDPVIDLAAIRRVRPCLPQFELSAIPRAGHELLRERDQLRLECLRRIDEFLDRSGKFAEHEVQSP